MKNQEETNRKSNFNPREEVLLVEHRGPVALLTLNRPKVLNARNRALRKALVETCQALDEDQSVRVLVLTGSGERAFCTGLDLAELAKDSGARGQGMVVGDLNDIARLAAFRKPAIAAVNGLAVGGGLELSLACDLRLAAAGARFGLLELRRGTIPGNGGTQRLTRIIGISRTLELLLTAELMTATQAESLGLVNRVVPDGELVDAAVSLAETIAQQAPLALTAAKEAVWKGAETDLDSALKLEQSLAARLRSSQDFKEGVTAFREKRPPVWQGR